MSAQTSAKKNGRVKNYFKGVKAEMRKVIWPTKKELVNYTAVVVGISAITAIVVAILDFLVQKGLSFIIS